MIAENSEVRHMKLAELGTMSQKIKILKGIG